MIGYQISGTLWDPSKSREIPTPKTLIAKIDKVFELWGSVSEADVQFRNEGLSSNHITKMSDIPNDGKIHIIVSGVDEGGTSVSGVGSFEGTIPSNYKSGSLVINTKRGLYTLKFETLIHEIGHALGLHHSASLASVMTCGTPAWGDNEFFSLSEQDRFDFARLWNPQFVEFYTLSGKVTSQEKNAHFDVIAVNTKQGHVYSTETNGDGVFSIYISKSGTYKLFAKGLEGPAFDVPVAVLPTWYTTSGSNSNDPQMGSVLEVDGNHKQITNIAIKMIESPVPFNLHWGMTDSPTVFNQAFLHVGDKGTFVLPYSGHAIKTVTSFGSSPDYKVSFIGTDSYGRAQVEVEAFSNAEEGERLIIARGQGPEIEAGIVGIHIRKHSLPSFIPGSLRDQNGAVASQLKGEFDFKTLKSDFWK